MPSLLSLMLTLTLFLAIVSTAPSSQGRSFKVHQKRRDSDSPRSAGSGMAAMGKAYRKFGIPLPGTPNVAGAKIRDVTPDSAVKHETRDVTSGSQLRSRVDATAEEGDSEFISPVTIGGQTVNMDFDTGSSDL